MPHTPAPKHAWGTEDALPLPYRYDGDDAPINHPDATSLFDGHDLSHHRGRVYRASPRLRLWQMQQQRSRQEAGRYKRANRIGQTLNDGTHWIF